MMPEPRLRGLPSDPFRVRPLLFLLLLPVLWTGSCFIDSVAPPALLARIGPAPSDTVRAGWGSTFADRGAHGTFVLYDPAKNRTSRSNPARAAARSLPASTFKVYNALVALETSTVGDPDSVFVWDGTERFLASWNEDQSLRDGLERSTVWLFQRVAEAVGRERYAEAFRAEPYGNDVVGPDVRVFWLDGSLQISPDEQVRFLDRLRRGDTAFSDAAETTVRDMMPVLADTLGVRLVGKTGWGLREGAPDIGWLVGWVERPAAQGGDLVYALNAEASGPASPFSFDDRLAIAREILAAEGVLPEH